MREYTVNTLIIRPSALGDTLLLIPSLHQLTDKADVILVGRKPGIDFLKPLVLECLDFETQGWHTIFLKEPRVMDTALSTVERAVLFLSDPEARAQKGLGNCLKNVPIFQFPPFPPDREKTHVAYYLASCLKKSGLPLDPLHALEEAKRRPLLELDNPSRRSGTIVVHPGSGSKEKNYSPEFWLALLKGNMFKPFPKRVLLLGPAEEEWHHIKAEAYISPKVNVIHSPSRDNLLSLLAHASLYLGHDSGITHLAALLGTPTIALFRGSDPRRWAPLGPHVTVIADDQGIQVITRKIREALGRARTLLA